MLRFALLVLLIANAGYFAWAQGWMQTLGWAPAVETEAQRVQQQVRPDVLLLRVPPAPADLAPAPLAPSPAADLTAATAEPTAGTTAEAALTASLAAATTAAAATAAASTEQTTPPPELQQCLQASGLDDAAATALRQALPLLPLPVAGWSLEPTPIAGRWMVYMGKFSNDAALDKRRADLRSRKIEFDRAGGNLEPGLSLGRFSSEEAATRELTNMLRQGVRGARVVQERASHTVHTLHLPRVTAPQRQLVQALPSLDGKPLRPCS